MGVYRGVYSSTETAKHIDVNRLTSKIKEAIKKKAKERGINPSPADIAEAVGIKVKEFSYEGQSFSFSQTPNKFGGYRWFIICPKCNTPVLKVYKPEKEEFFWCRKCHNLRAPSALYGPTKQYKEIVKPLLRMERIKEKLANKKLSSEKEKALIDEYEEIQENLKKSSLYRKERILSDHDT